MGIAGPIASGVIGLALLAVAWALGWIPWTPARTPGVAILVWLGYINLALGAFNMIPGFPLEGGRVLRAIIWWITRNANRSTRIAAQVGRLVGLSAAFRKWREFAAWLGLVPRQHSTGDKARLQVFRHAV
jgi:Zn-dependent protease